MVFLSVEEFLPKERAQALLAELLDAVTEVDQGNREDILDAICDMADSIKDATIFAKAALLKDPDKSNATLIDIANAQFMAGNLELAKQWLGDVRNPGAEDEEAYLDLQAAIADREGRKSDCIKMAHALYEKFPKVVMAQGILETGYFTSHVCLEYNNLFGLRRPSDGSYYRFDSWEESVKAYRDYVQYKYKGGDYYAFLRSIGYAENPYYVSRVKSIATNL